MDTKPQNHIFRFNSISNRDKEIFMKLFKVFGKWEINELQELIDHYLEKGYSLKEIGDLFYVFEETEEIERNYHVISGGVPDGWNEIKGSNEKIAVVYSDGSTEKPSCTIQAKGFYQKKAQQNLLNAALVICAFTYITVMLLTVENSVSELITSVGYCISISAVISGSLLLYIFLRAYSDSKLVIANTPIKGRWQKRYYINLTIRIVLILAITSFLCNWCILLAGFKPWF